MIQTSRKLYLQAVPLHTAVALLPAPSAAGDGGEITQGRGPHVVAITIDAAGDAVLSDVYLCAYDVTDAAWRIVALLNGGNEITVTATLGWEDTVIDVPVFDRLAVFAAVVGAGPLTIKATPIQTIS